MNTISQSSFAGGIQQLFASSASTQKASQPPPPPPPQGGSSAALQSIKGSDGQSLIDISDQLETAAQEAYDAAGGSGDFRADVRDAIRQTLTENGFDVDEVESAMEPKGGRPPGGGGPPRGGLDDEESFGASFVQSFLGRFREGVNLDLVG